MQDQPFARLRALRSGAVPWEDAWKHAPPEQRRSRFSGAADRLAGAQALVACCARKAEAAAAERTIGVLTQLAQGGGALTAAASKGEKLLYAAAMCVAKWWEIKLALGVEAQGELQAAEAAVASARAEGEATLAQLQQAAAQSGGR